MVGRSNPSSEFVEDNNEGSLILSLPDFNEPFVLEIDASETGLGTIMSQRGHPIAFFSHALTGRAQYKLVYERELMAIVIDVQKWRHYLLGKHFIVKTE